MKLITSNAVSVFMNSCDQTEHGIGTDTFNLYCKLVDEEYKETINATNLVEIIDGVIDSIWVAEGLKNCFMKNKYYSYDANEKQLNFDEAMVDVIISYQKFTLRYEVLEMFYNTEISILYEKVEQYINSLIEYALCFIDTKTLQECWDEVKRSNMSKISDNGKVLKNYYGKVIKPETFSKADLRSILTEVGYMK